MKRQKRRPSGLQGSAPKETRVGGSAQPPGATISSGASAAPFPLLLRSERTRIWLLGLLLVAGVVLAYQPVWHAGFIWDDDAYVTQNKLLTAPDGLNCNFPKTPNALRLPHPIRLGKLVVAGGKRPPGC